jgi:hypothetical protein
MKRMCGIACTLILAGFCSAGLMADSETRPTTEVEKKIFGLVLTAFAQSIPPGLPGPGWTQTDKSGTAAPDRITAGLEIPLQIEARFSWFDPKRAEENRRLRDEIITRFAAQKPDPAVAPLQARQQKLFGDLGAAMNKGNTAELQRIQKEAEILGQRLNVIFSAQQKKFEADLDAAELHDVHLEVNFTANRFYLGFNQVEPVAEAAAGGASIYRVNEEGKGGSGWNEGRTCAFLGNWKLVHRDGFIFMEVAPNPKLPQTTVQAVYVEVRAERSRARAFLEAMNWPQLRALVRN